MAATPIPPELPRLARYVAGLPDGLASHPECKAKGSLVRSLLEEQSRADLVAALPGSLRPLALDPPMGSEWIPEVQFVGLIHAVADLRRMRDGDVLAWSRERNRALFRNPAYRILVSVVSPARLIRFAGARWGAFHRGSTLSVEDATDTSVRFLLEFPQGLFDPLALGAYGEAFAAALEASHANDPEVRVDAADATSAEYLVSWT
jgi:hypothetical protein